MYCKTEKLESIIEENIDNVFYEVNKKYKLVTGDISPCQSNELDTIKEKLYQLTAEYINQNKN